MNDKLSNGKHKGKLFSEVPTSYIRWMVDFEHSQGPRAQIEMNRRRDLASRGEWKEPKQERTSYGKLN